LLCGEIGHRDLGCGCDIFLILRENHEEYKLPSLIDDIYALLVRDQGNIIRWDCLEYPIEFLVQSYNNTVGPRLIYNMMFP